MVIVIAIAGLFSALETAIVSVSRYKLKLLKDKAIWAKCAYKLKKQLTPVLVFSLFGNSLFNIIFTTIATILLEQLLSHQNINFLLPCGTFVVAILIIIFSEAIPKIIASKNPISTLRYIALISFYSFIAFKPVVWLINKIIAVVTFILHIEPENYTTSAHELKEIIADKNSPFRGIHMHSLLKLIDLEQILVKETLIPLRNIEAINISRDNNYIAHKLRNALHTQLIVYQNNLDNIIGYIHVKDVLHLPVNIDQITCDILSKIIRPLPIIHSFSPMVKQIQYANTSRIFLVVNEYGDNIGIACLENMFEIIFGNFTTQAQQYDNLAIRVGTNELLVDGSMALSELNNQYGLFSEQLANIVTLNGLIIQTVGTIPTVGVCFRYQNLIIEVVNMGNYWVEKAKITKII